LIVSTPEPPAIVSSPAPVVIVSAAAVPVIDQLRSALATVVAADAPGLILIVKSDVVIRLSSL
jgi:hypothetical protein